MLIPTGRMIIRLAMAMRDAGRQQLSECQVVYLLTIAGMILRLIGLGVAEYWYDEAFTSLLARLPAAQMLAATAGDTHPPLYYVIMWLWGYMLGYAEVTTRLPAALASVACIPIGWYVARQVGAGRCARLVVAGMLAISPIGLYFGQEARMYSMLQLAVLLSLAMRLHWTWSVSRRWLWIGMANLALLYLHNYGMFYVAALAAVDVWQARQDRDGRYQMLLLSWLIPGLLFAPWMGVLAGQMATVQTGYWIEPVTIGQLVYTLTIYLFGPFVRQWVLLAAPVAVGLLLMAVLRPWRGHGWLVWWLALAPAALAVIVSLVWHPIYLFRGLIGSAPFIYLLIGQAIDEAKRRRLIVGAIVLPLLVVGLAGYWLDIQAFKSTTGEALRLIQSGWQPGDALVATNDGNWVMFTVYQPEQVYLLEQCPDHDRGALSDITRDALGVQMVSSDRLPGRRTWLLWNWGAPTSQCNHDRAAALVAGRQPYWVASDTDYSYAGIWLLER